MDYNYTNGDIIPKNSFAEAFQGFDEDSALEKLDQELQPKSYYRTHKAMRYVSLGLSYLFNLLSAIGAAYLVYWLTEWMGAGMYIALLAATLFLVGMEWLKRHSSLNFWKQIWFQKSFNFGWFFLSLAIFGISAYSTYHGGWQASLDQAPPPPLVQNDSSLNKLYAQVRSLEADIARAKTMTWRNKVTRKGQAIIQNASAERTTLMEAITAKESSKDSLNQTIRLGHEQKKGQIALLIGLSLILLEIVFEACMAFEQYYWYRSYVEWKQARYSPTLGPGPVGPSGGGRVRRLQPVATDEDDEDDEEIPGGSPTADIEAYEAAWKHAKKNYDAWASKLDKGKGTPQANRMNMQIWQRKMAYYENKIAELSGEAVA